MGKYDELVKRLREERKWLVERVDVPNREYFYFKDSAPHEAADAIESLEAENERLQYEFENLRKIWRGEGRTEQVDGVTGKPLKGADHEKGE